LKIGDFIFPSLGAGSGLKYMKKVNVALVRLLQFMVFVLFTFMVIVYFGAMVLLPLDAIALLIKLMGVVGLHGFIGALIAIPVVGYLCLIVYKTPGLCKMVIDTGIDLVKTGKLRVEAFNEIAEAVKA
jgi:hypothetical protein